MEVRAILLFALVGVVVSQKLFFKSNTELQKEEEKATCCLDGKHCCPRGLKCDVIKQACINGDVVIPWTDNQQVISHTKHGKPGFDKKPSVLQQMIPDRKAVECDASHECPTGNTCCKLANGQWGCCPRPNAVCCSDHVHCCPSGTTCDVSSGKCSGGNIQTDWLQKTPAIEVGSVMCDSSHECPQGSTCCKLASGLWGCCPLPSAVCCSDHVHCCPSGTTCDVSSGKCNRGNIQTDWLQKTPAIEVSTEVGNVQCDASHYCKSGTTCCKLASGQWGCCPLPNAVCCSDQVHCCPSGTTCDVSSGKCNHGNIQTDWLQKTPAIEVSTEVGNVQCDASHYCKSGTTCCKLASGQWGCCPLPNAVCCSDQVHCCPSGTTCDVSSGKCNHRNIQTDWLQKTRAIEVSTEVGNVQCDASHYCKSGTTCCKLASGQWGCCPLPNAVCCADQVHCCPSGTTCDVSSGKCNRGNIQTDWLQKTPAIEVSTEVGNVQCDASHYCKSGTTCCKLASGQWGCCPLPNAVCCADQVHCCPSGTTCDVSSGKCNRGNIQTDWLQKTPAIEVSTEVGNVQCDASHYCKSGTTCCKLASGQWGCCPLPNAVCCADQVHCCPSGTTCDVSSGKCNRGNIQTDWLHKTPAIEVSTEVGNVQCDASHYCKSGTTCCKLASGQWGCCPLPNAVCCADQVHCCPSGTTCDVSSGKCNHGNMQTDWLQKTSAIEVSTEVGNVQCDASHYCKSGTTCCKLASGQWGCCPLPNAVCCADQVHCCPSDTTCDVSSGKCNRGNIQTDWLQKTPAIEVSTEVGNVQCDASHYCKSGTTCCKLASGQWGCCPLPNAVCCADQVHCCPSGTTCDVSSGKCNRGNIQADWLQKTPAIEVSTEVGNVQCDASHYCKSGTTCCKLASGQWGCCPLPNAVCCADQVHCCPSGTTCDVSSGKCNRGNIQTDWLQKTPAIEVSTEVGNVQCDASHYCKSGTTCCKLASGQWGCCPLPNAVCCADQVHCCPSGTTCDVSSGKCNRGNIQTDWLQKTPAIEVSTEVGNVQCDASHYCKSGTTCCKLASGQWGCCPLPNAVCCADQVHCCPSDTTCDVSSGKCNRGNIQTDWLQKTPAIEVSTEVGNVQCDASHYCKSGTTCCKLASGQWGCCPLPNAVCCADQVHCCPSGTTCDVSSGKCNRGNIQTDWLHKTPAIEVSTEVGNVQCDASHYCKSGTTCCKLASGQWGCCPLPNAVCCADQVHCCPSGTTCDVSSGKCNRGNIQTDWLQKTPAIEVSTEVGNVQCDASHYCKSGTTCCKLASGQWGCCPLPNAVCCADHVHCCPSDTTCDVSSGKCNRGNIQTDWLQKTPAIEVSTEVGNVQCDASHYCKSGTTCCKLSSGQWGCCPLPNAVCCADQVHCCPSGTTCDVSSGKCNGGNIQTDWLQKTPAIEVSTEVGNVQCDASHYCKSGTTCCKLASGQWGCCPLPNAVCCSDQVHCCPSGTTCDVSSGKCNGGNIQTDWLQKTPAIEVSTEVGNVQCDASHYCKSGTTCCKLASGQWGCCPLPNAVCCADQVHCCPSDTTCDVSSGKCNRGNIQTSWLQKTPAIEVSIEVGNVQCDASHYCKSGTTCCKLASGQWGCCPLPNAVCCADQVHCCPSDTTCDVSSGKCNRGNIQTDWLQKTPAIEVSTEVGNVQCDASHYCKSGTTCCKLASGQWGCCPLPNAVCCSDHVHCCPSGTTCDVSSGKCNRGNMQIDWFMKEESIVKDVICPDGSECQDGQTCCRMGDSLMATYGCCPLPNAVCCNDGQHCCPCGYTCNVGTGTCQRGYFKTPWFKTITSHNKNTQGQLQEEKPTGSSSADQQKGLVKIVPCAGTSEGCPDGYTCCTDNDAGYNCCPYHNAVCCPDKQHCCPNGYVCDEEPGICRIPEQSSAARLLNSLYAKKGSPLQ